MLNRGCCGGRDYGPVRDDEGPSDADVARFARDTVKCPKCRADMYDEAEICLECGHDLAAAPSAGAAPWVVATAVVVIGALMFWVVL